MAENGHQWQPGDVVEPIAELPLDAETIGVGAVRPGDLMDVVEVIPGGAVVVCELGVPGRGPVRIDFATRVLRLVARRDETPE